MQQYPWGQRIRAVFEFLPRAPAVEFRRVAAGLLLAASLTLAQAATPASDSRSLTFDIPGGSLESILERFAAEAGVSLSFTPSDVRGKHSDGVHGTYTVADALTAILRNTGLSNAIQTANGYALSVAPATPPAAGAQAADADSIVLPPIQVSANAPGGSEFAALSSSTLTRTDTPLFYIPQSVAVVTPALMQSQQIQSVSDGLRDVSGITIFSSDGVLGAVGGTPYIRGFLGTVMMNGLPATVSGSALSLPVAALAGIEVIKGANSILAGSAPPSGVINVLTKQPQSTPVRELTVQAGSYGDWLGSVDLAGPIGDNQQLTYRFVVSGETASQDFFGQQAQHDIYVAPSIAYDNGTTRLVVGVQQHTFSQPVPPYTVMTSLGPLATQASLVDPAGRFYNNDTQVRYDLTQHLGDVLTFRSQANYSQLKTSVPAAWDLLAVTSMSPLTGDYIPLKYQTQSDGISLDNNLKAVLFTGPVKHTLLLGMSYSRTAATLNEAVGSQVLAPIPWSNAPAPGDLSDQPTADATTITNTFYLQDQIAWHALHILASISRSAQWGTGQQSQSAWSPNIGVLYQFAESVAAYANAQRSFYAQPFFNAAGGSTPPETGRSVELGLKFDSPEGRYTGTVALFRSAEFNTVVSDPAKPGFYDVVPSGYVSRGVEMDVTGHLVPGWKLSASYTYNILSSPPSTGTTQLPRHSVSLWTTYDLQSERWHGWGVGLGIRARSSYASADSTGKPLSIPGQLRTDASIYYHARDWSTTLGVKNLFNRRLYGDYGQGQFVEVQPTRLFYLTGTYDF
jgi:iron complex outermembrane receptor protein